jgi:methylmalonyl-CoA mutase C-terminal domain/subunit
MDTKNKFRILIANSGLDGHNAPTLVLVYSLRDAGMEVIYSGLRQPPAVIVRTSIQEDVDLIGLSIFSGIHCEVADEVLKGLNQAGGGEIPVIMGGIIPEEDIAKLTAIGVRQVFLPGTPIRTIIESIANILAATPQAQGGISYGER